MVRLLIILLISVWIWSCHRATQDGGIKLPSLHSPPVSIPYSHDQHFVVNPFSGDSIPYLNNYLGDTVQTGIPVQVHGWIIDLDTMAPPQQVILSPAMEISIKSNVSPISMPLPETIVNENQLAQYQPNMDTSAQVVFNDFGDTIPIGIPIALTAKWQGWIAQPISIADNTRIRDNAQYNIQCLDVEQGLLSSKVNCVFQDKSGSMWIGTTKGTCQYDGVSIRPFINLNTIENPESRVIFQDKKGYLWFGTINGLYCTNGISYMTIREEEGLLYSNGLNSILEDRHGDLWFGLLNGIIVHYQRDKNGLSGTLTHYKLTLNPQPGMVTDILEDRNGKLWIATTRDGLFIYDGHEFKQITTENGLPGNACFDINEAQDGSIWVGTSRGIGILSRNQSNGTITIAQLTDASGLSNKYVRSIKEDKQHNVWIGTFGGGINQVYWSDGQQGKQRFITHFTEADGLANNLVNQIYPDTAGNIWICTNGGGVNIFRPGSIQHVTSIEGVSNKMIRALYQDHHQNLWLGTEGNGILKIPETRSEKPWKVQYLTSIGDYIIRWTTAIAEDQENNLWFGSTEGVLKYSVADQVTGRKMLHFTGAQGFTDAWVTSICQDKKKNIWFGTYGGGLIQLQSDVNHQLVRFIHYTEDDGFPCNYITDIKEDPDGFLWIATDVNGLCRFLPAENGIDGTYIVYSEKEGLARNHMWSICLDAQSNLWIGTEDRGLCKVSLSNTREPEQFTLYTTQQGLSDDHVRSILADTNPAKSDQLWASTLNGLNQVTFGSNHDQPVIIRSIQKTEGLKRSDFTFRSMALDQNGKLWVGTEEGLEVVEPSSFTASTINPKPKLKQLDLDGHYVQFRNHDEKNQKGITFQELEPYQNYPLNPEFSYHHHHLTFHFSAIDWTAPSKIQYTYNMEGVDQDWSSISAETKADYRNLPSGTHTFKVCAIGESQQWSEPFEYTFTIRPPWWYSWWAVVMYSLLGGFVLYRTYRFQLDRKLEIAEKQKLVELDRVKNRLYTNITHEFRTPLTLIHGPVAQALSKNTPLDQKDIQSIHRQSQRMQELINQMLDLQKLESGMLKPDYTYGEIVQVLRYMFGSFEIWARDKNISMIFSSSLQEVYMDFDQEKMTQIITNLVNNAIKHTPAGGKVAMTLGASLSGDFLLIQISDTGSGIQSEDLPYIFDRFYQSKRAAYGGTGIGLAIVKNLTELLGGHITVESQVNVGSIFKVMLPITKHTPKALETTTSTESPKGERLDEEALFESKEDTPPGKPMLLVVEDHPDVSQYLISILAHEFDVLPARNGQEGLRLSLEQIPDLIISDIMMPGMDGFELCKRVKTDIKTSHIPIILLTGRGDHDALMSGIEHGADVYLVKPFHPEELILRVKKLLELRANLSLHYRQHASLRDVEPVVQASARENEFLKRIRSYVEEHMNDAQFNMDRLSQYMAMSHPQLHRKITALTGESTGKFVRSIRLMKAKDLLRNADMTIAEIAYETGFSDPGYFTKVFTREFNLTPSDYRSSGEK